MKCPNEDMKEIWPKMTTEEKQWYYKFLQAQRGNTAAYSEIASHLSVSRFHEILKEIRYENNASNRFCYTITEQRKPRYSEWDYGWFQRTPQANKRWVIDQDYYDNENNEMFGANINRDTPLYKMFPSRKGTRNSGTNPRSLGTNKRAMKKAGIKHAED